MCGLMKSRFVIALFLASVSSLFGRSYVGNDPTPPAMGCGPAEDPCASCAQIWPSRGPDWIITPNGGPCVACGFDLYITIDFLYWTAREDQLTFAIQEPIQTVSGVPSVSSRGTAYQPDWGFGPGYKLGFGSLYDHDGWDIYAEYTSFSKETGSRSAKADANERLTIKPAALLSPAQEISAKWKLEFGRVDLSLGRNFFISRYLKLKPFFGLMGTWQKQSFPVETTPIDPTGEAFLFSNHMDYWGVGIRAGLDTSWHATKSISLVADTAISGVWQGFDVHTKVEALPSGIVFTDYSSQFHAINPALEFLIGIRWETWFCCDRFHFSMEGGWELQWWANQNHFACYLCEDRLGSLYLQGLTARVRFDF